MPVPLPNQANLRARPHRILLGPPVALRCAQRQRLLARRFMYSVCRPEAAMACSLDISTTGGATPNLQTHLPQRRIRARALPDRTASTAMVDKPLATWLRCRTRRAAGTNAEAAICG